MDVHSLLQAGSQTWLDFPGFLQAEVIPLGLEARRVALDAPGIGSQSGSREKASR